MAPGNWSEQEQGPGVPYEISEARALAAKCFGVSFGECLGGPHPVTLQILSNVLETSKNINLCLFQGAHMPFALQGHVQSGARVQAKARTEAGKGVGAPGRQS